MNFRPTGLLRNLRGAKSAGSVDEVTDRHPLAFGSKAALLHASYKNGAAEQLLRNKLSGSKNLALSTAF